MGFMKSLKGFDAYHRPEAHLTRKTASGAVVSIVGVTLMVLLFSFEMAGPDASPRRRGAASPGLTRLPHCVLEHTRTQSPPPRPPPSVRAMVYPYTLASSSLLPAFFFSPVPVHTTRRVLFQRST